MGDSEVRLLVSVQAEEYRSDVDDDAGKSGLEC
jgi:hypothetical protein